MTEYEGLSFCLIGTAQGNGGTCQNIEGNIEKILDCKTGYLSDVDLREENSLSSANNDSDSDYESKKSKTVKKSKKQKFKCSIDNCDKSFNYKWILDRHINSHFCFKMFKCEQENCNKAYKSKENLILHFKNKHLGEKPYQCRFCISRFSHRNGKTYHERKHHTNSLPHACTVMTCDLKFASKSALNFHLENSHS